MSRDDNYKKTVKAVATTLSRYPLERLQRPGRRGEAKNYVRFLFDDGPFGEGKRPPKTIDLLPGVGEQLLALSALLVPALQTQWTSQVAGFNDFPVDDLREHLFGGSRIDLSPVRLLLHKDQSSRCFYCERRILKLGHIDHVIPWSLYAQNAIENLVLAHDECNGQKSSHLAVARHVERWVARGASLSAEAEAIGWISQPDAVLAMARSAYGHAGDPYPLWSWGEGVLQTSRASIDRDVLPLLVQWAS
jgi:5-methylcytosine-specific restriction endonuclease McrA